MKKNKVFKVIKIAIIVLILVIFSICGRDIFLSLNQAKKSDEGLINSLTPQLYMEPINKAAGILKK